MVSGPMGMALVVVVMFEPVVTVRPSVMALMILESGDMARKSADSWLPMEALLTDGRLGLTKSQRVSV